MVLKSHIQLLKTIIAVIITRKLREMNWQEFMDLAV